MSTAQLPRFLGDDHPSEESLFAEDDILVEALESVGYRAERVSWRDSTVDWESFEVAMIRSTWDYIDDLSGFLETLGRIESCGVRLINPLETVSWNCSKFYLNDLTARGVPTVPTVFLTPDDNFDQLRADWITNDSELVVKPVVGVGSFNVEVVRGRSALARALERNPRDGAVMIQPFLPSIVSEGEWSFVFGAGNFLYSVLKQPAAGDFRVQVMYGARIEERPPDAEDLEAAKRVVNAIPLPAHIARIDMVRLPDGSLGLMEAELIEPQLHLFDVPEASALVANAVHQVMSR